MSKPTPISSSDPAIPPAARSTAETASHFLPRARLHRDVTLALILGAIVAIGAVLLDLPRPAADDLMFTGAAIEVSQGHGLRNPLLADQFGTDEFLVYPPFYFLLLGGWLRVTGISTGSLLVFEQLCYLVAGLALAVWLDRRRWLGSPCWIWPACFAVGLLASLGTMGLRPEAAGFAVLVLGLCLVETTRPAGRLAGWLLIGSSLGIAPHMLAYATAALILAQCTPPPDGPSLLSQWRLAIAAAFLLFGLLLWAVDGRIGTFTHAVLGHASRTSLPLRDALAVVFTRATRSLFGRASFLVAMAVLIAGIVLRRRISSREFLASAALVGGAGFASALLDVSRDELRLFTVLLWCLVVLAYFAARPRPLGRWAVVGLVALLVALVWDQRGNWILLGPRGRPSDASLADARGARAAHPLRQLLIDSHAARYLFNYRLPRGARDWTFSRRFPHMWPASLADFRNEELWIIGRERLWMIEPHLAPAMEPAFTFLGHSLRRRPADQDFAIVTDHAVSP